MSPDIEEKIAKFFIILAILGTIFAVGFGLFIRYHPEVCAFCIR